MRSGIFVHKAAAFRVGCPGSQQQNSVQACKQGGLHAQLTCLLRLQIVSHDTRIFRFELPSPEHVLGLPVGKHLMISTRLNGKLESRAYTPVSSDDEVGYFDLLVKVYFKNVHPKFPEGGKITQYLESLNIGDSIDVLGPKGSITYMGTGQLRVEDKMNKKNPPQIRNASVLGMIAGGSGITPMLQVRLKGCVPNCKLYHCHFFLNLIIFAA
jgi:NAD(P)H-flavin reductase